MNAGDRVSDYIIEHKLGEGGMGSVYRARHAVLDQQVAIKILDPEVARKPSVKERFIQEANIQAKLRHPHIVQVLTATQIAGDLPALVMEYVDGNSLFGVLEKRGALPVEDGIKIMEQVLAAVGYAHRHGVIHRDLKPSNVMVMASGEIKVTDFGIAKVMGSARFTRTGTAMGSPHYMSPEQIRRPETVDARSDIYSLGCVFYELLAGQPPFFEKDASGTESDYDIKTAHVTEVAPSLCTLKKNIPDWLEQLVMGMLQKEPEQRPPSCDAVLAQVKQAGNKHYNLTSSPSNSYPVSVVQNYAKPSADPQPEVVSQESVATQKKSLIPSERNMSKRKSRDKKRKEEQNQQQLPRETLNHDTSPNERKFTVKFISKIILALIFWICLIPFYVYLIFNSVKAFIQGFIQGFIGG